MCELLGLCFNVPVDFQLSIHVFKRRGFVNRHGWGVAFYPDEAAMVIKEPVSAPRSKLLGFLEKLEIRSRIFIAHVRLASCGGVAYKNTHPFLRELGGRDWAFAHNGTVNTSRLELGRFKPVGETDSEALFCHLLSEIEKRGVKEWRLSDFEWLHAKLSELNKLGSLNCLFSDGERLFAYHDKGGYNGLRYVWRAAPFPRVKLEDEDLAIDLNEMKDRRQKGYVIATRPLTQMEEWLPFNPGELVVFSEGEIVYRSSIPQLSASEQEVLEAVWRSPSGATLGEIVTSCSIPHDTTVDTLRMLLAKGLIRQVNGETVTWDDKGAVFCVNPNMKSQVERWFRTG